MMTNRLIKLCLSLLFALNMGQAQQYFNADNNQNISITSSPALSETEAFNTMNGKGLDGKLMEASRFLSQASFGMRFEEVKRVADIGFEAWMDEQMAVPPSYLTEEMWYNWQRILDAHEESFTDYLAEIILYRQMSASEIKPDSIAPPLTEEEVREERLFYIDDIFGPTGLHFNNAWWERVMIGEDQLRQRVAYALSQILVVSSNSDLGNEAEALCYYYDILLEHAFGNFRDLLEDVTLSPAMGFYLSHLNNPKAIPEESIHPDENYAREVMQLFTIGLYELNIDGSRKKDAQGNDIPTYNNTDIKEMARIFTGLGPSQLDQRMYEAGDITWTDEAYFGLDFYVMSKEDPLIMYQEWHDEGEKSLMDGLEIPAGQDGMTDIGMALDFLFNHDNTGPFISRQLIQRLVKSNPSPQYIERVARIFNNNGRGERGDLASVVKAILLDPEARECEDMMDPFNGKMAEPLLRRSFLSRMADLMPYLYYEYYTISSYDSAGVSLEVYEEYLDPEETELDYWNNGYEDYDRYKQFMLMSPTVFNFYLPDHQPVGEIAANGLVAPEFKIHDTSTAINYLNGIWDYVGNPWWNYIWWNWEDRFTQMQPSYDRYLEVYYDGIESFIHHLDIEFTSGQMRDDLKQTLRDFAEEVPEWVEDEMIAKYMIYLVMISPDFTIEK